MTDPHERGVRSGATTHLTGWDRPSDRDRALIRFTSSGRQTRCDESLGAHEQVVRLTSSDHQSGLPASSDSPAQTVRPTYPGLQTRCHFRLYMEVAESEALRWPSWRSARSRESRDPLWCQRCSPSGEATRDDGVSETRVQASSLSTRVSTRRAASVDGSQRRST